MEEFIFQKQFTNPLPLSSEFWQLYIIMTDHFFPPSLKWIAQWRFKQFFNIFFWMPFTSGNQEQMVRTEATLDNAELVKSKWFIFRS